MYRGITTGVLPPGHLAGLQNRFQDSQGRASSLLSCCEPSPGTLLGSLDGSLVAEHVILPYLCQNAAQYTSVGHLTLDNSH